MDAGGGRRTLRHPPLELEQGRHPHSRLSCGQPNGQGAGAQARRRRHDRGGGDLRLSRRRISARQAQVPIGSPRRGVYLKWLFFGPNCIEAAMMDRANPRKDEPRRGMLGYGDFDTVMDVTAKAVAKGPYLMGGELSLAHLRHWYT